MKLFTALFLIVLMHTAYSQTRIYGTVTDASKTPLPGANIFIKDSYDGISSDVNGRFDFVTEEEGSALLVVSYIGYKTLELPVELNGSKQELNIVMEEEAKELGSVVISAGSFEASDENKAVILRPLDIVTTGAEADIYAALETLPGTQQVGETEGLFVRGGSAAETKTIIDEMVVQNPFYSSVPDIPSRGRFSPFLFKGTVFSTGGYSAQYGQALSSVLVLKTQDIAEETRSAISIMPLGLGGSHTQRWENSSLAFEGGYYNLGPYFEVQKQRVDWEKAPESIEGNVNFRQKIGSSGLLKAYASHSYSLLSLYSPDLNNLPQKNYFKMQSNNFFFNTNYRDIWGDDWAVFGGYSISSDNDNISIGGHITQKEFFNTGKATVTKGIFEGAFLTFGGEFFDVRYTDIVSYVKYYMSELYLAGFAESDVFFTNDFAARLGVRVEHSKLLNKINAAPRVSLAYRLGTYDQLNFAYGQFFQTPSREYLAFSRDYEFEKATHYILNYQYIGGNRTFRIEGYYKDYDNLAKGTTFEYPVMNLPGSVPFGSTGGGYAKGIDVFWRDSETLEYSDYWLSYSYLDTKRDFKNYPVMAPPVFSSPHTFSVVFKRWIPSITTSMGVTYTFASGRPYYNPNNKDFLSDRASNFHNMSLNFSYLTSIFNNFTVVFASVDNLFGYNNIYGYRYSDDGSVRLPVVAPALRSFFIGMFISLGEEYPF